MFIQTIQITKHYAQQAFAMQLVYFVLAGVSYFSYTCILYAIRCNSLQPCVQNMRYALQSFAGQFTGSEYLLHTFSTHATGFVIQSPTIYIASYGFRKPTVNVCNMLYGFRKPAAKVCNELYGFRKWLVNVCNAFPDFGN